MTMGHDLTDCASYETAEVAAAWPRHGRILWSHRRLVLLAVAVSFVAGLLVSVLIPKRFTSVARIMPPEQQGSNGLMLAELASKAGLGNLGSLAPLFFTGHSTTDLFVDLLRSGTVSSRLIDRYGLQTEYRKRYRIDTAKLLARYTTIADDKRSGVITIEVVDPNPVRARDLAQGYLDELNRLVVETNTSAAHRERVFVEQRLQTVQDSLEQAQTELSEFSSHTGTIDLKEQTRAEVDAGSRLEAELLVQESNLSSLREVWGDENVRVREARDRIAALRSDLSRLGGTTQASSDSTDPILELGPALREVPRLSVPYADLYRRVRVQETVLELLTQQYESARIEEARDIPVVSVIDPPGVPEKKSFPPRTLLTLAITTLGAGLTATWLLFSERWRRLEDADPRKALLSEIARSVGSLRISRGAR